MLLCQSIVRLVMQTGKLWAEFKDYETAEACYAKAMEYAHYLLNLCNTADNPQSFKEDCAAEIFGLYLDRTSVAWQLQQKVPCLPFHSHVTCQCLAAPPCRHTGMHAALIVQA